jgi:hypothetical protein
LGYGFSDYDFYVKKLIDFAINSKDSKIKNVYHYDCRHSVSRKFKTNLLRNPEVSYQFVRTDFSNSVPDFENIGNICPIAKSLN